MTTPDTDLAAIEASELRLLTTLKDIADYLSCGDWTAMDLEDNEVSDRIAKRLHEAISLVRCQREEIAALRKAGNDATYEMGFCPSCKATVFEDDTIEHVSDCPIAKVSGEG